MALDATDWTVEESTKVIQYIGDDHGGASPTYATVIEFHRWLQDLADDAVAVPASSDELDITKSDPSRRSTDNIITLINGYTLGVATLDSWEFLYDGSIIQADGDVIYDGIVNFGNADVQIQIHQDGVVIADDWWNQSSAGLNPDSAAGISHRFLIPVRTAGADIDGRRLLGTCRRLGYTYNEFGINGTARGNNVLALSDALDLNNETVVGTLATWDQFVNDIVGYNGIDVDNNSVDEYYYSSWDNDAGTIPATPSMNDFYEYCKYVTRDGSAETLYGISGELFRGITHEIAVTNIVSGPFNAFEELTWGTGATAGVGQMFAIDSVSAPTTLWIQLLSGIAPTNGLTLTGTTSGADCDVNVTVTDRSATINTPFVGVSTGSALIGAYGVGIDIGDLTSSDKVKDLGNNVITPPNYVTNIVAGLISGEDRVLVAPWDGSSTDVNGDPAINKNQFLLSTILDGDNETAVVVKAGDEGPTIPSDTPSSGYLRVVDDAGNERRLHYSSWTGSTFTIDTSDGNEDFLGNEAAVDNNVYLAYIDELASGITAEYTSVQTGTRNLVVIVRDGAGTPIKQFISSWSQGSSAGSITAIRTSDE
ncbi:MAG: hypothetical protein BBJ57_07530 [Desulfobacterales bacterium PC51MH44]|nr:MAG: hypothetical protein BBJ57_07530 [Desulfobacterales bacterium PC51MH44]